MSTYIAACCSARCWAPTQPPSGGEASSKWGRCEGGSPLASAAGAGGGGSASRGLRAARVGSSEGA
eukprot:5451322-Alexandrium_andersonii.AAC.1